VPVWGQTSSALKPYGSIQEEDYILRFSGNELDGCVQKSCWAGVSDGATIGSGLGQAPWTGMRSSGDKPPMHLTNWVGRLCPPILPESRAIRKLGGRRVPERVHCPCP
jgi:hypothetical protein